MPDKTLAPLHGRARRAADSVVTDCGGGLPVLYPRFVPTEESGLTQRCPRWLTVVILGLSCTVEDPTLDSFPTLPESDSELPSDSEVDDWPIDSNQPTPVGQDPDNWLYLYQFGTWEIVRDGGEPVGLTGILEVFEFVDWTFPDPDEEDPESTEPEPSSEDTEGLEPWELLDRNPLVCHVIYAIDGIPSERLCASCDVAFDITFTILEGNPRPCYDPELPPDEATRRFGWQTGDSHIHYDFSGVGIWYPWYVASFDDDTVEVSYHEKIGASIEEEESS
jgi:hypothetical protein